MITYSIVENKSFTIVAERSGGGLMKMNFPVICVAVFFFAFGMTLSAQSENPSSGSWSGVIINSNCTADEAFAEAPEVHGKRRARRQAGAV